MGSKKTPLQADKDLVKEFNIESDLEPMFKLSYVRSQLDEMKKACYRYRVDSVISQFLIEKAQEEDKPEMEAKFRENLSQNKVLVRQFSQSIKVVEQLLDELEKEVEATS